MSERATPKKDDQRKISMNDQSNYEEWQDQFFEELADYGNVARACRLTPVGRSIVYALKHRNEHFAYRFNEALQEAVEKLEEEATERARTDSDTLLIFLLKAHKPQMYRDRYEIKHSGSVGGASLFNPKQLRKLSGDDLEQLDRLLEKLGDPSSDEGTDSGREDEEKLSPLH